MRLKSLFAALLLLAAAAAGAAAPAHLVVEGVQMPAWVEYSSGARQPLAIGMAFMNLEDVYPPYPPLLDVDPSPDPRADIAAAIRLLGQATAEAHRVADIVRYPATICDLYDLDLLADQVDPRTGGWSGQWP